MKKDKEIKEEQTEEVVEEVVEEVIEEKELTTEDIISNLEDEIKSLKNELLKQRADVENTRKRLEKERINERKYAAFSIAKQLVTPIDHFELALSQTPEDEAVMQYAKGFKMIKDELMKALEQEGVSEIDALDEDYDPNFHQAVMTAKVEGVEANKVVEVLQKGYLFKERVIRPAMVKISE
jgi:molecular chaperone GrpE